MRPTLHLLRSNAPTRSTSIGFIGLGAMGHQMAAHLLTKTLSARSNPTSPTPTSFVVCDNDYNQVSRFISAHQSNLMHAQGHTLVPASHPGSVAKLCGTVVTMLPSSPQVREVYLGEEGILAGLRDASPSVGEQGTLLIDCTTCDRATGVDVANIMRSSSPTQGSISMLDAPVSGGVAGAAAATLTFLVGSDDAAAFERAKQEVLDKMGARSIHCGPNGAGLTAKIANNLVLGATMLATAEAMALGVKGGLSPQLLAHVLNTSTGRSWSSEINNPAPNALRGTKNSPPADRDWTGGFAARLQAKDLRLALQAAEDVGLPVPVATMASKIYDRLAERDEYKDKDFSVVFKALLDSAEKRGVTGEERRDEREGREERERKAAAAVGDIKEARGA